MSKSIGNRFNSGPENEKVLYSYVKYSEPDKLISTTVARQLEETTKIAGSKTAVISVHQGIKKTYYELNSDVDGLVCGLLSLGLKKGDRLGLWARNSYEWIQTAHAAAKGGFILVSLCPAFETKELEFSLNQVECKVLVVQDNLDNFDYYGKLCSIDDSLRNSSSTDLSLPKLPFLKHVVLISDSPKQGTIPFKDLEKVSKTFSYDKPEPDDTFCVNFTSGTTGKPKGATLSHYGVVNTGRFCAEKCKTDEETVMCVQLPLYHTFGTGMVIATVPSVAGTVVLPSSRFNAVASLNSVQNEKCNILVAVPTMLIDILKKVKDNPVDLSTLKIVKLGGAVCSLDVLRKFEEAFGTKIVVTYGCTELSGAISSTDINDGNPVLYGTVGRVLPNIEVKIVDQEGKIVPIGQEGEVKIRGFSVFQNYWRDEETTRNSIDKDGFFATGDLGKFCTQGYLYLVGRIKDIIIRGGVNIYPSEIENILMAHECASEVQVVGVPDYRLGEEICAFVLLKPSFEENSVIEELRQFCKGKMAHFKVPKYFLIEESFPVNSTGKILKYELIKLAVERLRPNLKR